MFRLRSVLPALILGPTLLLAPQTAQAASFNTNIAPSAELRDGSGQRFATGQIRATFRPSAAPGKGALYLGTVLRGSTCGHYRTQLRLDGGGSLSAALQLRQGSSDQAVTRKSVSGTWQRGDVITVASTVTGFNRGTLTSTVTVANSAGQQKSKTTLAAVMPADNCPDTGDATTFVHLSPDADRSVSVARSVTASAGKAAGLPTGTPLTRYTGPLVIKTPGTVIDRADIAGRLVIEAPNVRITRSRIVGPANNATIGVITVQPTAKNFVIEDSEIRPSAPSVKLDGLQGSGFTARRVEISGGVDNIKVFGNNVTVEDSYLHDTDYFASDPQQGGGPTHNDNVQVLGGDNIKVHRNKMVQAPNENASLQVTQDYAPLTNFAFTDNAVDGGTCSANFNHKKRTELRGFVFSGNVFGRNTKYANCAYLTTDAVTSQTATGSNKFTDGTAIWQKYMG